MDEVKRRGTTAIYAGSFDPVTNGHMEIIRRALELFDRLIVAVARNPAKSPIFTVEERIEMIRESTGENPRVTVDAFDGLLVEYARQHHVNVIIRGLRALSDFEYEFQMALMNRRLNRDIDTIFLMTGFRWFYVSSRIIKEAASFGGSVEGLVPNGVNRRLMEKFSNRGGR
ncbi:MAG: pantetheine-phosphate adenylyltransferase [Thermodesulfobacteriota bacterium]